jgi:hypothetical protein
MKKLVALVFCATSGLTSFSALPREYHHHYYYHHDYYDNDCHQCDRHVTKAVGEPS